jgi:hypothetical protein
MAAPVELIFRELSRPKPEDEKPTNIAEIKTLKRDDVTPSLLANASPQWTSLSPQKRAAQRL